MKHIFTLFFLFIFQSVSMADNGIFDFLKNHTEKPASTVLIIFYKEDCPYCQKMSTVLKKDEGFSKLLEQNFSIQKINIQSEEGRFLADKFNVHAVPTLINFDIATGSNQTIKGFPGINKLSSLLHLTYTSPFENNNLDNSVNLATCGNGLVEAGETCDDGNLAAGDGCSPTCGVETGFICTGNPSVCTATCGDGIVAGGEQCDDGNVSAGDGCSATCSVEPGFICTGSPSVCTPGAPINDECNNAIIISSVSGTASGDNSTASNSAGAPTPSCQGLWQKDLWYRFTLTGARPVSIAVDGIVMTDPVVAVYSGACNALVQVACDDDSGPGNFSLWTGNLMAGTYYIRVLGFGSGVAGRGTFNLVYNFNTATCGNNSLEFGEECDDGNLTNGDGCNSACSYENPAAIRGVAVTEDATRANPSAMLDIKSDSRGVLIPRLSSAQRNAISFPVRGLIVYDVTTSSFWYYKTNSWFEISNSYGTGFSAYNGVGQAFSSQFYPVFPIEQYDDGNNFASNVFTVPSFGLYQLSSFATFTFTSTVGQTNITLRIENTSTSTEYASNSIIIPAGFSGTIKLNASMSSKINAAAPIGVRIVVNGSPGTQQLNSITFSGFKLY
jgi:cysteine-rich repeat protein